MSQRGSMNYEYIWPKVFTEGKDTFESRDSAIATALCGWANCMASCSIPQKFGEGIICLGEYLGYPPSTDVLDVLMGERPPKTDYEKEVVLIEKKARGTLGYLKFQEKFK